MPDCKYGMQCYRKRPEHFSEFTHPPGHPIAERFANSTASRDSNHTSNSLKRSRYDSNEDLDSKKTKTIEQNKVDEIVCEAPKENEFRLFWTKIKLKQRQVSSLPQISFNELLCRHGELKSQVHFNFMVDVAWFVKQRPDSDKSRVLFVTGDDLGQLPRGIFQISVRLPPFGSHHTKMSILKYKKGLCIAIYSGMLIYTPFSYPLIL